MESGCGQCVLAGRRDLDIQLLSHDPTFHATVNVVFPIREDARSILSRN